MEIAYFRAVNLPNHHHFRFFRFLDKHAPGWRLCLRPNDGVYQMICDIEELECEEEFDLLPGILRKFKWITSGVHLLHRDYYSNPMIKTTAEHAAVIKMFWEDGWKKAPETELQFKYD